jgi:hypothetical protein
MLACFYDGQPFDGEYVCMPCTKTTIGYTVDVLRFCSFSCVKAHILECRYDPILLVLLQSYTRDKYGITMIKTAPDRRQLSIYRTDGKGVSLEDFRRGTSLVESNIAFITHDIGTESKQVNFVSLNSELRGLSTETYSETRMDDK